MGHEVSAISQAPTTVDSCCGTTCRESDAPAEAWFLALAPAGDWSSSVAAIRHDLDQPTLEQRFGISAEAAKLLTWIESFRPEDLFVGCTPEVEDRNKKGIGLNELESDDNFVHYLEMLVDEINEKTDYNLKVQPWRYYSRTKTRIRVGRKRNDMDEVLKRLHWLALNRGMCLDVAAVRQTLESLVDPHPMK